MSVEVVTLSRGELRTTHHPQRGDAAILILEDEPEKEPLWLDVFEWRLAVGFRDIEDSQLSTLDRLKLRIGRAPGEGVGIPRNAMTRRHSAAILEFGNVLSRSPSMGRLLIACEYGKSRSVAIARHLAGKYGWQYSSEHAGNSRVLRLLSEYSRSQVAAPL